MALLDEIFNGAINLGGTEISDEEYRTATSLLMRRSEETYNCLSERQKEELDLTSRDLPTLASDAIYATALIYFKIGARFGFQIAGELTEEIKTKE